VALSCGVTSALVDAVGVQRSGRHGRQRQDQCLSCRSRAGCLAVGGQDGADVCGPPAAERDRPLKHTEQRLDAVRGLQGEDLADLGGEFGDPGRCSTGQERFGDRGEREELLLCLRPRACSSTWGVWAWAAVVVIDDADLTGCHQGVFGVDLAGERLDHPQTAVPARPPAPSPSSQSAGSGPSIRPDPNRIHDSLSTFRVVGLAPISGRSDGSWPSRPRSVSSRCEGMAQISECTTALTSAHHTPAAALTRARSAPGTTPRPRTGSSRSSRGPSSRPWHSRPGSPPSPWIRGRRPRRSRAGTGSGPRTGRSRVSAPQRWRPHRPPGSPSGPRARPWGRHRGPRSTRPTTPAPCPLSRPWRTIQSGGRPYGLVSSGRPRSE
jgi:hypothetical protein